ncbi:Outer membrane protein P5 precursor [compost metagenome]
MKKRLLTIFVFLLSFFPFLGYAQEQKSLRKQADLLYEQSSYAKAAAIYERLAKNKKDDVDLLVRLANSYRLIKNYEQSKRWFQQLQYTKLLPISELLNYAEVMHCNVELTESRDLLKEYELITGTNDYIKMRVNSCDSAKAWMQSPALIVVKNLDSINTPKSEWGAWAINDSVIVYTAERAPFVDKRKGTYSRTGQPYLGIYERDLYAKEKSKPFDRQFIVSNYHSGPLLINAAHNLIYITRTYNDSKTIREFNSNNGRISGIRRLELWYSEKKEGHWSDLKPFKYNNPENYSVGHAALSKDGNTLYFVSDMPGTLGKTDIWYCTKLNDGSWSSPVNCGFQINTDQEELFPTIGTAGELYFSSTGRLGMGGLDIFKAIGEKSTWKEVTNMRFPVNSVTDDFLFTPTSDTTGFLSSDRRGGKGSDDIYSYLILPPPPPPVKEVIVEEVVLANNKFVGIVVNKLTSKPLVNVSVTVDNKGEQDTAITDDRGRFGFELKPGEECSVKAEKEGFLSDHKNGLKYVKLQESPSVVILQLDSIILNKAIKLEHIYYDSGKWNLKPKSKTELNKLVALLTENPTIKIELSSHTDSRSSDKANLILSQKRAKTAVDYIISKGIAKDRLVAKGYGETKLLNKCKNGVKCSNAAHQMNRRTEIAILSF